ncbi:MAG: serine hydrolase domain-containing protein [candidate division Zixibacteria bacterium]|nr:serine hydrolase domain-containing protein [candidate division Zixibacteria bacterium]
MKYRCRIGLLSLGLLGLMSMTVVILTACSHTQTLNERFQTELKALHDQYRFPGATAAYVLPDGTFGVFAVGLADIELRIPMIPDSRMLAASIGKTFVGATVLALAHENLLNLDDPISKWLGDRSWFSHLPNNKTITVRQLLNHTSGIPNHVDDEGFIHALREKWLTLSNSIPPEDLIAFVLDKPPLFKAGEGWYYTDTGYLLLGLIIERVTGDGYYEEVTRRFLEPLHLTFTTPSDRLELPGLAAGYMAEENAFGLPAKTTVNPGIMAWHPGLEWTGGGFVSNSKDLVVWAKALFEGRAIEGSYLDDLLQSVPISDDDPGTRYGLAVAIHENGPLGPTWGHGGWIPGYSSSLRYYPNYGIAIAFQINTDIGIVDHSTPVIEDMESRLAKVVVTGVKKLD